MSARARRVVTLAAAAAAALSTVVAVQPAGAAPSSTALSHRSARVCATAAAGFAACDARVRLAPDRKPGGSTTPRGFGPADVRAAYNLGAASGAGRTVAIVDAYNAPNAESDLATYRAKFGLSSCTTANGCFRKVSQTGSTTALPSYNSGWAEEIMLDLDMVSATCPDCRILLVEASSSSFANLGTAVNYAATQGVSAISNSYGGSDSSAISAYNHPGIAITASTGDSGYGVESPASFPSVVAVGGTSLTKASNARGWSETAWSGAGSGCSSLNSKPAWQTSATQCSGKASADVSAVADPNTGVAVYFTPSGRHASGSWLVFGGTSASSPIIAAVYTMGGNLSGYPASFTWGHPSGLFDVSSGSNGTCPTVVWCTSGAGWDGPTGLGTPNGTSAF